MRPMHVVSGVQGAHSVKSMHRVFGKITEYDITKAMNRESLRFKVIRAEPARCQMRRVAKLTASGTGGLLAVDRLPGRPARQ